MAKKAKNLVIDSPLKAWPGNIELPDPNEFDGIHWGVWKAGVNKPARKTYALTHLYCYTGLELLKAINGWNFESLLIEDVQSWEDSPEDERIKLVAWLGRTMMDYLDGIVDPKE